MAPTTAQLRAQELLAKGATYDDIQRRTSLSKGAIWRIATAKGLRKHEDRIQARAADRAANEARLAALEAAVAAPGVARTCDVLDFLRDVPDAHAQLAITSPPYNIGRAYGGDPKADRMRHLAYLGWMLQVISELARVLRPGGVLAFQVGSTRLDDGSLKPLDVIFWDYLILAGLTPQNRVCWPSDHGLTPKRRLSERWEVLMIFSKGEPSTFNATPARRPQKHPDKRAFRGPRVGQLTGHPLGAHPSDVWNDIPHLRAGWSEKTSHPAQFPIELARRAIMLYTMPGDVVLDPFTGSGSSMVAAFRAGRAFEGADLHYSNIREERMRHETPDVVSSLPGVSQESLAIWEAEARRVRIEPQLSLDLDGAA